MPIKEVHIPISESMRRLSQTMKDLHRKYPQLSNMEIDPNIYNTAHNTTVLSFIFGGEPNEYFITNRWNIFFKGKYKGKVIDPPTNGNLSPVRFAYKSSTPIGYLKHDGYTFGQ